MTCPDLSLIQALQSFYLLWICTRRDGSAFTCTSDFHVGMWLAHSSVRSSAYRFDLLAWHC